MRTLIQRVQEARVKVNNEVVGEIQYGILAFLGVCKGDTEEQMKKSIDKLSKLRIFEDENAKMNLSLLDTHKSLLLVSQFTLAGNCQKGNRPSFDSAESPDKANLMYEKAIEYAKSIGLNVQTGVFQADMKVELINDGPVTFVLEF